MKHPLVRKETTRGDVCASLVRSRAYPVIIPKYFALSHEGHCGNIGYHPDTMSRRRMTNAGKRRKGKIRQCASRQKMWGRPSGAPNRCPPVQGAFRARARGARIGGCQCPHAPEGRKPQGNEHISRAPCESSTRQPCADEMGAKARSPHEEAHTCVRMGR